MRTRLIWLCAALLALCGCSLPPKFSMYPKPLSAGDSIDSDMAVVLIGNAGPSAISYLQFDHSSLPALNVRGAILPPGRILPIPVPVGLRRFALEDYTTRERPGVTLPNGMEFGYVPAHTPPIDIACHCLFYIATISTGASEKFSLEPDPRMLRLLQDSYPQLSALKPINFSWPE